MARAATRPSNSQADAIAFLKNDHRTVEQLLDEFEQAEDDELQPLAERICGLLTVHTRIEEELFYPPAREALEEEGEELELIEEAAVEHGAAKELIAKVEAMSPQDEKYRATVKVLGEYVKHHVKEEERELFPKLRRTELDLKRVGAELADRKQALMGELGIEEEAPPRARRKRAKTKAPSRGAARKTSRRTAHRTGEGGRAARH